MRIVHARTGWFLAVPLLLTLLSGACSKDDNPTAAGDTTAPAAITNLAHGAVTTTSVILTWTATGDDSTTGTAAQYDIRYSLSAITAGNFASATHFAGAPAPAVAGTSQQVTVTGLAANTPYHFAMKTKDEANNGSDISNVVTATTQPLPTDTTAPAAITNLAHGAVTTTSVVLTWTATGDDGTIGTAAQYDIRYSLSAITEGNFASAAHFAGAPAPAVAGTNQQVTVTGLTASTPYYFAMKAADETPTWSTLSNVVTATTSQSPDITAPAAITNLAHGAVTTTSVVLTWTATGDDGTIGTATQYDIRYSLSAITEGNFASATHFAGAPVPALAGTNQQVTVTGLTASTPYYFAMKTADETPTWSTLSNVVTATTSQSPDITAPAAITNLAHGAVTTTSVVLTWTAPGDDGTIGTAGQYDIRYSLSAITEGNFASATHFAGAPVPALAGTNQQVTVTGLTASTPYYFAMKTADETPTWSTLSNLVQATTSQAPDITPPAAVTDLDATALDANSVALTWTATGDDGHTGTAHAYDVRYSTSAINGANWASATQATGEPAPAVAGTAQDFTITGLLPDQDYFFALKTRDEIPNESGLSNVSTAHTPSTQTSPPGLLAPDFPDTVCISSTDTYAQTAKLIAQSQLSVVNAYAGLATAFFNPLQGADWQHSGDCWTWEYGFGGCNARYEACGTGTDYTYTMTYNGSCSGENFDNWVAYRVVVDNAARSATFYAYDVNSTTIQIAWVWTWAADENSGTYTFYDGDPATAPVQSTIEWARSADHNVFDTTYTIPDQSKIVSHAVKDPCSGWVHTYQWDSSGAGWWMDNDIVWNADQSGYWDTYDDTGALLEHHIW